MRPIAPAQSLDALRISNTLVGDVEEQATCLDGWEQRYQQLSSGRFQGSMLSCSTRGFQFFMESLNQKTHQAGSAPEGTAALAFAIASDGAGRVFGKPFGHDCLVALSPRRATDFCSPATLTVAGIAVEAGTLERLAMLSGCEDGVTAAFARGVTQLPPPVGAQLRAGLVSMGRLVCSYDGSPASQSAMAMLRATLLETFVAALGMATAEVQQPGVRRLASHRRIVDQAVHFMQASAASPIGMAEVCAAVGVQARVLQYCFKDAFGVSPIAFLRGLRLHGVRQGIRACPEESLGDIAARWGIWHLGRFASDYRQLFGELPSDTKLRRRTFALEGASKPA